MELQYLSQDAIEDFKVNFDLYKKHYGDATNEWFLNHWNQKNALQNSTLGTPDIVFSYDEDFTKTDKNNVIAIHSALKSIPKAVAADERLWAALCHTYGWDFVKYRRNEDIKKLDSQRLKSLFFFSAGTKRSCYLNCLAKYWWCGNMVYDAGSSEPYAALDTICSMPYFSSLVLYMSSSNFTANRNLTLGMVESFRKLKAQGVNIKVDYWKDMLAYLNKLGAVIILDTLSRSDVTEICDRQIQKIVR